MSVFQQVLLLKSLVELGITVGASVRDIWKLSDAPAINIGGSLSVRGVAGHSSRFFRLTPQPARVS
jgi:hypothetical protein